MSIVGRFAPSPSGRMHLGNVFSALLAWCSAKSQGGGVILRIEDLDPDRCRPEYTQTLKEDLTWLGLNWDGEQQSQSQRGPIYARYFEALQTQGLVYPCYCSRAELHTASAPHAADGELVYPGTCRNLSEQARSQKQKRPAWRIIVPDRQIAVEDGLQGMYQQSLAQACGDFIIRRADGVYAYQLAVVVDDALAGVTEVVRGCDLLSSTPRQIFLQQHLGFSQPKYYHVPLLLAADGRRLSKRDRDLDLGRLRQSFSPEQILGYLAGLCGILPPGQRVCAREVAQEFSWKKVKKDNLVVENLNTIP